MTTANNNNNNMSFRTTIRQSITPYLPPPVVNTMNNVIDPMLGPYVGDEPTITLIGTILIGIIIVQLIKIISFFAFSKEGKAIIDDDDDDNIHNMLGLGKKKKSKKKNGNSRNVNDDDNDESYYTDTVVLCGPPNSGKTRLFYTLCHNQSNVKTITSLRPNVSNVLYDSIISTNGSPEEEKKDDDDNNNTNNKSTVRLIDYPGHEQIQQLIEIIQKTSISKIILVLDSTQPVSHGADILYSLLSHFSSSTTNNKKNNKPSIYVACNKVDKVGSKNWRRIKIQLRTELERLLKVRGTEKMADVIASNMVGGNTTTPDVTLWYPPGKPLDFNQLDFIHLHFNSCTSSSTSSSSSSSSSGTKQQSNNGIKDLRDYILTGANDENNTSSTAQIRRV